MDPTSDLLQTTGCTWLSPISMFLGIPLDQVRTLVKFSEGVWDECVVWVQFHEGHLFGSCWIWAGVKGVCCGYKTRTLPVLLHRRWTLSCARSSAWLLPPGFGCVSDLSGSAQLCATPSLVSWGRCSLYSPLDGKSGAVSFFGNSLRACEKPAGPVLWPRSPTSSAVH